MNWAAVPPRHGLSPFLLPRWQGPLGSSCPQRPFDLNSNKEQIHLFTVQKRQAFQPIYYASLQEKKKSKIKLKFSLEVFCPRREKRALHRDSLPAPLLSSPLTSGLCSRCAGELRGCKLMIMHTQKKSGTLIDLGGNLHKYL